MAVSSAQQDFDELKELLLSKGAWKVAAGDLTGISPSLRAGFSCGISILVEIPLSVINRLGKGVPQQHIDVYNEKNILLDELGRMAEKYLISRGYDAFAQTRDRVLFDFHKSTTLLPHKTVATRAGLGWIGKNAMLVTKERGSAVRLTSVLTNAPFPKGKSIDKSFCGDCMECTNNCPGAAPLGTNWSVGVNREDFFHMHACRKVCVERTWAIAPGESSCSLCVLVCPWTQRAIIDSGLSYDFPSVVFAQSGDLEEILTVQKLAYERESLINHACYIPPLTQTIEELREEFAGTKRPMIFLKLVQDRQIVGSVRAWENEDTAYIGRLFVHPQYQKRGYGKKLLQAIEACYNEHRFELFTGANSVDNIAFYQRCGYHITRRSGSKEQSELIYFEK